MNKKKRVSTWLAPLMLAGCLITGTAQADDNTPPQYGPGMMGGYGGGYGPGMMGGYGGGYGPGMMGGYGGGYGPGMMGGGWGMHGMMEPLWALKLTDKQRSAIDSIMQAQHNAHWPLMSRLFEAYGKLDQLYSADKWDSKEITKAYDDIFKIRREMIDSSVQTHNRIMEQLTTEQKEQLKRYRWESRWR